MKTQQIGSNIFFGDKDLKQYTYAFHFPNISFEEKKNLSSRINKHGDWNNRTVIIIIESESNMNDYEIREFIKKSDRKILLLNGIIKQIDSVRKNQINEYFFTNNLCRILTKSDLIKHLNYLERNSIDIYYEKGLPKCIDKNGTVALLLNIREYYIGPKEQKKLKYHTFSVLNGQNNLNSNKKLLHSNSNINGFNNSQLQVSNKINAPDNFSIFCTKQEKELIENSLRERNGENSCRKSRIEQENVLNIYKTPAPRKEHNYCHLCLKQYEEYFLHLKDPNHVNRFNSKTATYESIDNIFNNVRNFWREEERKKSDLMIEKDEFVIEIEEKKEDDLVIEINPEQELAYNTEIINLNTNHAISTKFATSALNNLDIITESSEDACATKNKIEPKENLNFSQQPNSICIIIQKENLNLATEKIVQENKEIEKKKENEPSRNVIFKSQRDLSTEIKENNSNSNCQVIINNKEIECDNIVIPITKVTNDIINDDVKEDFFKKRKFSQTKFSTFMMDLKRTRSKKLKKLNQFKAGHTKDLINIIENLKYLLKESLSMKLK